MSSVLTNASPYEPKKIDDWAVRISIFIGKLMMPSMYRNPMGWRILQRTSAENCEAKVQASTGRQSSGAPAIDGSKDLCAAISMNKTGADNHTPVQLKQHGNNASSAIA